MGSISMPTSCRSSCSRLVRTVTAVSRGRWPLRLSSTSRQASIMRRPPLASTMTTHAPTTAGLTVDPPAGQLGRRAAGPGGSIRDVVKLEIQKPFHSLLLPRLRSQRAGGGDQLLADLDPAVGRIQPAGHGHWGGRVM